MTALGGLEILHVLLSSECIYRVFQKTCNNFLLLLKLGLSRNELKLYIIFKPITIQLC